VIHHGHSSVFRDYHQHHDGSSLSRVISSLFIHGLRQRRENHVAFFTFKQNPELLQQHRVSSFTHKTPKCSISIYLNRHATVFSGQHEFQRSHRTNSIVQTRPLARRSLKDNRKEKRRSKRVFHE